MAAFDGTAKVSRWWTTETSYEWIEDVCMNCGHHESAFSGPSICPKCGAIMENGKDGPGLMPRLAAEAEEIKAEEAKAKEEAEKAKENENGK